MAAKHEEHNLAPEEKRFRECMATGDDFTKIEIYRSAASWYGKALELKPGDGEAAKKLAETKEKIRKENRAIYAIVAIAAVIIVVTIIIV